MATTIDLGKIRLQWKGDYSNATSYELLDVVKFKGDSYVFISTIAAANKTPDTTSEWDLMVSGGDQWSTGTSVPTGGNPGDMYLKTDDEKVYTNTAGSWGVVGDMGGSRWTSGTSAPSGGEDGDFYLKTDDEKVYERVSGSWVVKLDIGGGVWTSGTSVPTGGEAGDFYIKTDDEKIYENVAGTWTVKLDIGGGVWTSGTSNGTGGESGDWHVNTATKDIQENVSGTWTTRVNLSVSGSNIQDLGNVPALSSGKFLTNDGTNTSWATVDVAGSAVGGDVSGTVSNIQIAANAVTDTELNSAKLNGIASGAEVNPSFKTVGGSSILGSGDIATLPSGGSVGQVIKKDGSNNPAWAADEGGKILQVKAYSIGAFHQSVASNSNNRNFTWMNSYQWSITPVSSTSKILLMGDFYFGEATSHYYFDVWADSAGFTNHWMQPADDGIGGDGYTGMHRSSGAGAQEQMSFHFLETHGVSAGTSISYQPHHAHWGARTVSINKYDTGSNANAMAKSGVILMEVEI